MKTKLFIVFFIFVLSGSAMAYGWGFIMGGYWHTAAMAADGNLLVMWGWNYNGQLGDGTTTERHSPVQVLGEGGAGFLSDMTAIEGGGWHSVALKTDGTVRTWGSNYHGQLGDGTTTDRHTPVQVLGEGGAGFLSDMTAIVAGANHTVTLKSDGTVWAWGWNYHGQLGDGTWLNTSTTPVQVHGEGDVGFLEDIIGAAVGSHHTVALKSDGTVWAWGYNSDGQLGDGTTTERHTPVQVHGEGDVGFLSDIVAIRGGDYHTVALKSDGTVWAWGRNQYGQLGNGTTVSSSTPVQLGGGTRLFSQAHGEGDVDFLNEITAIAVGSYHTIALKTDGTVWVCGLNDNGQLGNGTTTDEHTPVQVHGEGDVGFLSDIIAIEGGSRHTVALKSDSTVVWTWGDNEHGQLGDGTTTDRTTPVQVDFGSMSVAEDTEVTPNQYFCSVSPNPFNSSVTISTLAGVEIEIYDLRGTLQLRSVTGDNRSLSVVDTNNNRTFIWYPDETIVSGMYLVRARMEDGNCVTKQIVLIK